MKKSLVLGILGLAVGVVSSYGQGAMFLDNYFSSTFNPVYLSAALGGGLVPGGFTASIYYDHTANQNITGSITADPSGTALPGSLNALLVAATGVGSTAPFFTNPTLAGYFSATDSYLIQPGSLNPAQGYYTIMVVAYNGATYDTSSIRGHSAAVYVQDAAPSVGNGGAIGTFFPASAPMFTVASVPEPTTLALGTLGGLGLLLFRRKQA
jgi:hypothetical protein